MPSDGECDYDKAVIKVRDGLNDFSRKDTLLHEIMHAILHQQGRNDDPEEEERYVRALATGVIAVFQDNPRLAAWLAAPIVEEPT